MYGLYFLYGFRSYSIYLLVKRDVGADVKDMLNKSRDAEPIDSQFIDFMGEEAVDQYYNHYKKLNRIKQ